MYLVRIVDTIGDSQLTIGFCNVSKIFFIGVFTAAGLLAVYVQLSEKEVIPLNNALTKVYGSAAPTHCNHGQVGEQYFIRCYYSQIWEIHETEKGYIYQPYNGKAIAAYDRAQAVMATPH